MTSEEIEALRKTLKDIDCMQAVINSMQYNIESHNRVFSGKEVSIQNHTDKGQPIYISGNTKDKILELLNEESLRTIEKWEQKIKELK